MTRSARLALRAAAVLAAMLLLSSLAGAQEPVRDDPDAGVWLARRDAAEADRAVLKLSDLEEKVRSLEREVTYRRAVEDQPSFMLESEADRGSRDCQPLQPLRHVADLGGSRLEEFSPCGHGPK